MTIGSKNVVSGEAETFNGEVSRVRTNFFNLWLARNLTGAQTNNSPTTDDSRTGRVQAIQLLSDVRTGRLVRRGVDFV
jgi:hypothetical protein